MILIYNIFYYFSLFLFLYLYFHSSLFLYIINETLKYKVKLISYTILVF